MPDMICSLVALPPLGDLLKSLRAEGITIRRPHPWDRPALDAFIRAHFQHGWAEEAAVCFTHQPITCYIALTTEKRIVGFAAYEATRRNYFGPTGVDPEMRGKGIGAALGIAALRGLRDLGYAYAIIGGAGPEGFYTKLAGAVPVPFENRMGIYDRDQEPGLEDR